MGFAHRKDKHEGLSALLCVCYPAILLRARPNNPSQNKTILALWLEKYLIFLLQCGIFSFVSFCMLLANS